MIAGIDEVGRGPWAGPLVVGAVVLNGAMIEGLTDSKKLTVKGRERLHEAIMDSPAVVGLGWVHADELDQLGLSKSLVEATKRALSQIRVPYHEIIIDGTVNFLKDTSRGKYVTTMKKADLLVPSVSAASIIAKVARDEYMHAQSDIYPEYKFESHVGYGTAAHRRAIELYGMTPLHRRSFGPLKNVTKQAEPVAKRTTSKQIGDAGEDAACDYLQQNGFTIIRRNWKIKLCEIDIIAKKRQTLYFVEVKHRSHSSGGNGLDAITKTKAKQMAFAANMYAQFERLSSDLRLAAIATTDSPARVTDYVEL